MLLEPLYNQVAQLLQLWVASCSIRYRASGPLKTWAPCKIPHPGLLIGLGWGVSFALDRPYPQRGPHSTNVSERHLQNFSGEKWGVVQGVSGVRPQMGAGQEEREK